MYTLNVPTSNYSDLDCRVPRPEFPLPKGVSRFVRLRGKDFQSPNLSRCRCELIYPKFDIGAFDIGAFDVGAFNVGAFDVKTWNLLRQNKHWLLD